MSKSESEEEPCIIKLMIEHLDTEIIFVFVLPQLSPIKSSGVTSLARSRCMSGAISPTAVVRVKSVPLAKCLVSGQIALQVSNYSASYLCELKYVLYTNFWISVI